MIALFKVELRRLLSRRLFRWLTIAALLAFMAAGTIVYLTSDNSRAALQAARAQHRADVAGCVASINQGTEGEAPAAARANPQAFCEEEVWFEDPRFTYSEMPWIIGTIGMPLMMLGWLLGASAMGAEWPSRSLTTTLTWEPRRLRVLGGKITAAAVIVFAWVFLLQLLFSAAMYPAAVFKGTFAGIDASWIQDYGEQLVRTGAIGALAAVFGVALTAIGRNTAAAMGVGFVYLAVVEGLIRGFRPSWVDWLIGDNVALFLIGPVDGPAIDHTQLGAGLLLLAYGAVMVAIAAAVFRRREIA